MRRIVKFALLLATIWIIFTVYNNIYRSEIYEFKKIVTNLLIPRFPGSSGHKSIQRYLKNEFEKLKWHTEEDRFIQQTVIGQVEFVNLIFSQNPMSKKKIVLAAHYDSKILPTSRENFRSTFIGATDSAVSCAMLIDLSIKINSLIKRNDHLSFQVVFFDGEEAFIDWTREDSLYGSRHLAKLWNDEGRLDEIELLIVLDLIGFKNPRFYPLNPSSSAEFRQIIKTEQNLRKEKLILGKNPYFVDQVKAVKIEDDHTPFEEKNIKVLHIIPIPFPDVWHKMEDDERIIDFDSVSDITRILMEFLQFKVKK